MNVAPSFGLIGRAAVLWLLTSVTFAADTLAPSGWAVRLDSHETSLYLKTTVDPVAELGKPYNGDAGAEAIRLERVRSGLLPPFFNLDVKSPTLGGLRGSARVSFARQGPGSCDAGCTGVFDGVDVQEMFFSEHKGFSNLSPARTRSLFQRKNTWSANPRFEAEASYAKDFSRGSVNFWLGGSWQESEYLDGPLAGMDTESKGLHLGTQATIGGLELGLSYYTGEALNNTLMLEGDGAELGSVDSDNGGFIAQGSYRFNSARTRVGISYGAAKLEGVDDEGCASARNRFATPGICAGSRPHAGSSVSQLQSQSAWTVGVYHDVTTWLKFVAEYTNSETEWTGGANDQLDTFAIGGFFSW